MIDRETKANVYARDKYRCVDCGETNSLTIDHIIPVSEGGTDEIKNLQVLCYPCNSKKAGYLKLTFWQKLRFIWNVEHRFQSLKKVIATDFNTALNEKANAKDVNARFKDARATFDNFDKKLSALKEPAKDLTDIKNQLNGALTGDRKANGIKFIEIERKVDEALYKIEEIEGAFSELIEFLGIEYTPHGFQNKI